MNKLKLSLYILLTLAVIAMGLFLPMLATGLVEDTGADRVLSAGLTLPQLSAAEDAKRLSDAEDSLYKLGQLSKSDLVPVVENLGTSTVEDITAASIGWRDALSAEGIVEGSLQFQSASLYLSVNPNDPSDYYLLWRVVFGGGSSKKDSYYLELLVDDETQKLFYAYYSSNTECTDRYYRMDALTSLYFSQLSLERDTFFTHENDQGSFLNWTYTLPAEDTKVTEIQFEVDLYYFTMYIDHYSMEVAEP